MIALTRAASPRTAECELTHLARAPIEVGRAGLAAPDAVRIERGRALIGRTTDMTRRLLRSIVLLAMVVVGLLLCLDVAYFSHGSLEAFPTDEQTDKVRRVTAVLAAVLFASELGLWSVLRHLKRGAIPRHRTADGSVPPAA